MTERKTLEEAARVIEMPPLERIPVDLIDPDPGNPNEIPEPLMETLRQEIAEHGYVQPIIVNRLENGRFRMVDGEHRWRLVTELGYGEIPAVVLEEREDDAKIRLLTMNRLRGEAVPIRLAYFLQDLTQRIPEDELRRRLGMEEGEIEDVLRLADFRDEITERAREAVEREQKAAPEVLTFVVSGRDAATIRKAVESETDENTDNGKALARICREHVRRKKEEAA